MALHVSLRWPACVDGLHLIPGSSGRPNVGALDSSNFSVHRSNSNTRLHRAGLEIGGSRAVFTPSLRLTHHRNCVHGLSLCTLHPDKDTGLGDDSRSPTERKISIVTISLRATFPNSAFRCLMSAFPGISIAFTSLRTHDTAITCLLRETPL